MNKLSNKYDLEERTAVFAEKVINLCKQWPKTVITIPIISQLIRSSGSVGANYCEANGASSRKDFKNKIFICKKEAKETKYWLRLLLKTNENTSDNYALLTGLAKEIQELILIFSKIAANTN